MTVQGGKTDPGALTDLRRQAVGIPSAADGAVAADEAANIAGVQVRELSVLDELEAVTRLYAHIWRPGPTTAPVSTELLRAFSKVGNYVAGAFDGEEMLGACVGFFGSPREGALYSHIAGVSSGARGRSIGFAMKVHQRAWSMLRGVPAVAWTFDPLVRRNAYFNLAKLAAQPEEYLTNFYGQMHDAVNAGDDSDRLLVRWQLQDPSVAAACDGIVAAADAQVERASGAATALKASASGGPVLGTLDAETLLVAVPANIERLRTSDPRCAKDWRIAVRAVLGPLMADGARITGFDRAGWYILQRHGPADEETR